VVTKIETMYPQRRPAGVRVAGVKTW